MDNRVIVGILAISLIANLCMGVFVIEQQVYGRELQPGMFLQPTGTIPGKQESGGNLPASDNTISTTTQSRRFASLQGPAVLTTVSYTRRGRYIYQETNETGTTMNISVEIVPGQGRVLVQTTPLMGVVFQDAANTAVGVARNRTGAELGRSDIIFSIHSEGMIPAVDGPSAGALMTVITEAAVTGRPLWENRTLTGTINPDGSIGAIGGVVEKARAAKDAGKDLLLLPRENADLMIISEGVSDIGGFRLVEQKTETIPAKDYIESTIGIRVEYVDTINDVERYLVQSDKAG